MSVMDLTIISIENKGDLANEVVWLEATADIPSLSYYMVCDTTYTSDDTISNELRHVFWFGPQALKKGDLVALRTKNGDKKSSANDRKTTTYTYYWNLGSTVWNKKGDSAVLFHLNTWKTTKAV